MRADPVVRACLQAVGGPLVRKCACETGGSLKRPGPANAALASFCTARLSIVAKVLSMSCVVRQALLTHNAYSDKECQVPC